MGIPQTILYTPVHYTPFILRFTSQINCNSFIFIGVLKQLYYAINFVKNN